MVPDTRTRTDLERLVTRTVCARLHLPDAQLAPGQDLRGIRAFSSFVAVDILESLEAALRVEVPAEQLSAERLCSVEALTDLFLHARPVEEVTAR